MAIDKGPLSWPASGQDKDKVNNDEADGVVDSWSSVSCDHEGQDSRLLRNRLAEGQDPLGQSYLYTQMSNVSVRVAGIVIAMENLDKWLASIHEVNSTQTPNNNETTKQE